MSRGPDKRSGELDAAIDGRYSDLPRLIMTTTAAELLCSSKGVVYSLISKGSLRGLRIGKAWKVNRDEVLEMAGLAPIGAGKDE